MPKNSDENAVSPPIVNPAAFPLGSLESRAAARLLLEQPLPPGRVEYRILGKAEYAAYEAEVAAGRPPRYGALPAKSASVEEWMQDVKEGQEARAKAKKERQ